MDGFGEVTPASAGHRNCRVRCGRTPLRKRRCSPHIRGFVAPGVVSEGTRRGDFPFTYFSGTRQRFVGWKLGCDPSGRDDGADWQGRNEA